LNRLYLDNNRLTGRGFSGVKEMMMSPSCKIIELSLSRCDLQNDDLYFISKALEMRFVINILNLSHNEIRDEGAVQLSIGLANGVDALKILDLSYNRISVFFK